MLEKLGVGPVAGVEGAKLEREEERKERSVTRTPITRTFSLIYTALPMGWWNPEKLQSWAFAIPGPLVGTGDRFSSLCGHSLSKGDRSHLGWAGRISFMRPLELGLQGMTKSSPFPTAYSYHLTQFSKGPVGKGVVPAS